VSDAPRNLAFDVWMDVKHLAQWWGPNGFTTTTTTRQFDPRAGGKTRLTMRMQFRRLRSASASSPTTARTRSWRRRWRGWNSTSPQWLQPSPDAPIAITYFSNSKKERP
jgi:uncharacterized protein YndB with AHSA1/START domain